MPGSTRNDKALVKLNKLFPGNDAAFLVNIRAAGKSADKDDLIRAYKLLFDKLIYELKLDSPPFPVITPEMLLNQFDPGN